MIHVQLACFDFEFVDDHSDESYKAAPFCDCLLRCTTEVVLTFEPVNEILKCDCQMKATGFLLF